MREVRQLLITTKLCEISLTRKNFQIWSIYPNPNLMVLVRPNGWCSIEGDFVPREIT